MQRKKLSKAQQYTDILLFSNSITAKRQIIIEAMLDDQIKFLKKLKKHMGEEYYNEIVEVC